MDKFHAYLLTAACVALGATAAPAQATVLTFERTAMSTFSQAYGDRVTSTTANGFTYGVGTEGFTGNIETAYGGGGGIASPSAWNTGYGDLTDVLYNAGTAGSSQILSITFSADANYEVELFGFDMAAWGNEDYVIDGISIVDGAGATLYSLSDVLVPGDNVGPRHASFDFGGTSLKGTSLTILFDMRNLGQSVYDNIGIDNVRFGQRSLQPAPVDEPAMLALLGLGVLGMATARRRARAGLTVASRAMRRAG